MQANEKCGEVTWYVALPRWRLSCQIPFLPPWNLALPGDCLNIKMLSYRNRNCLQWILPKRSFVWKYGELGCVKIIWFSWFPHQTGRCISLYYIAEQVDWKHFQTGDKPLSAPVLVLFTDAYMLRLASINQSKWKRIGSHPRITMALSQVNYKPSTSDLLQYFDLTHWGLVIPYGDRDLGQHWLR